ncbi:hypothetical protein C6P22_08930 [Weissella confusa]|nr:hypothetical protein C6P22_08930 [Weissella confusa]
MLNQYYSFLAKKFQDWVTPKEEGSKQETALMLDLRTDFSLPCKLIAEEHFLYDSIFTRI